MRKRNNNQVSRYEWLSPIILTLVILIVATIVLMELGVEPFSLMKSEITTRVRHTLALILPQTETTVVAPTGGASSTAPAYLAETRTIGNWTYTITDVRWKSSTVMVDLTVKNESNESLPFGFSYPIEDTKFTSVYKLCAVDILDTVYWDRSIDSSGVGFYNREFGPGQSISGSLEYRVYSDAGSVYMCLAVGGKPGTRVFYMGKPEE